MSCLTPIDGYESYYLISDDGKVLSNRTNKYLKTFTTKTGYEQVPLNLNGKSINHLVHRLVAQAFIPNPEKLPCVNHKDGNKLNNTVKNLEWVSYSENMQHASKNSLLHTIGSNNRQSKLTEDQVKYIRSVYKKGDNEYGSAALGRKFGVDHKTIYYAVTNTTWRHIDD